MSELKLTHDIYVMVADGEKALLFRNEGDEEHPNLQVVREFHEENPPTREQGTDRPGRLNDGGGRVQKSAVEDADWHRIAKERFADEMAERLYKMAHKGVYKSLVLVAPPVVLGEMRHKLHKEVESKIVAEIPKTLTGHPVDQIEKVLTAA
ncbi:host attachment protein [Pseudoroseicyclus tamaricis]|uniref:Host attachment protein n=1 Tax=Pseudoroseicyclus tamaricis TaxID=2705421 RepID=A0A6B2JVC6_9RHOB|nr:host attachment family protein [Pseudoroseicyclus tamaricis]NDV00134.1 host attachment protein [Pseudoroseicyclus tamaricis]